MKCPKRRGINLDSEHRGTLVTPSLAFPRVTEPGTVFPSFFFLFFFLCVYVFVSTGLIFSSVYSFGVFTDLVGLVFY